MKLEGSRKVVFGFVLIAIGIAMDRFVPGGLTANLLDLMKFVTIGFFLGNGIEHVSSAVTAVATRDIDGDGDIDADDGQLQYLASQMEEVKAHLVNNAGAVATVQQALSLIITKVGLDKK